MNKEVAEEFVVVLLNARTSAHILHLKTRSYAAHKALEEFYNEVSDLADRLAENLQGKYGLLSYQDAAPSTPSDGRELMRVLAEYIHDCRGDVSEASDVQNIIDEIVDLISRTNYKLNFLS